MPRSRAVLTGVVRNVEVHHAQRVQGPVGPVSRGAAFDAWLDDGTGTLVLRWVGRDAVPGVRAGVRMCVEGTVADLHGNAVLLNPLYRFEPATPWDGEAPEANAPDPSAPGAVDQDGSSVS